MKHPKVFSIKMLIVCFTMVVSNKVDAQVKHSETISEFGFEASAGIQSFQINSDLNSLNQLQTDQHGGSIGLNFGNDYWKAKIKPIGFYNSSPNSQTTVKLIESGAVVNLYPLSVFFNKPSRLPKLYFTGGVVRSNIKINGSYLTEGQTAACIYDDETFSGSISSWNLVGGVGIEYKIPYDQGSISFFAEVKKGLPAATSADKDLFKNTSINNLTVVNVGFAIGINK